MIINTKADLEALRGTDAYAEALRRILGACTMWINDAPAGQPAVWRQESVGDVLAQFDLTTEELLIECAAAGIVPQSPEAPVAPPAAMPALPVPRPELWALANLTISDGDISGFEMDSGLAGAFALGVGEYLILLAQPLATDAYQVRAWDDAGSVVASVPRASRCADCFIVNCKVGSEPADPETLNLQIYRTTTV